MKITNLSVDLSKRYITKPLHKDALTEILKSEKYQTAHQLYLITNELKERYLFLELDDHDKYSITAAINVKYAYAGQALRQVESISFMKPLTGRKNQYEVVYIIRDKKTTRELFSFRHMTGSQQEVCELIAKLRQKTTEICKQNMY